MNYTKLLDQYLEKLLPVKKVIREPGVPLYLGNSMRNFKADYVFGLSGTNFVVEAKVGEIDRPIDGMKIFWPIFGGASFSMKSLSLRKNLTAGS